MEAGATLESGKGVPEDERGPGKPETDTSQYDEMERIAIANEYSMAQDEANLAKEEGREPAEWVEEAINEYKKMKEKFPDDDEETEDTDTSEDDTSEGDDKTTDEDETEDQDEDSDDGKKPIDKKSSEDQTVEIVVDGKKTTVLLSKIIDAGKRTLQKDSAADQRLEEATRLLREAKEIAAKAPVKPDPKPKSGPTDEELKQLRADYVRATQYGTEEEAVAAMEKWEKAVKRISAPPATETITKDDIRSTIVAVKLEDQVNAPPDEGGYADLMANPILKAHTAAVVDSLVEQGKGSYGSFETYKRAGDAVRLIGSTLDPEYEAPAISDSDEPADSFEKKRKKKKNIVSITPASKKADTRTKKKEEDDLGPSNPSDIIAEIAKFRGQG
jgi:hypothetical protein